MDNKPQIPQFNIDKLKDAFRNLEESLPSRGQEMLAAWRRMSSSERAGAAFGVVIALVFVLNILIPDKTFSANENRNLERLPEISVTEYTSGRLETKFEDYTNDQFLLRNAFIRVKSAFDVAQGGIKSNGVWKGKDGYLIEDTTVPSTKLIAEDVASLKKFKKQNPKLKMYFLLAPNAVSILKDKLPFASNAADQNKYMDEMLSKVSSLGITTIDVRSAFKKAAADGKTQLYYRTDHHWTSEGAELAWGQAREAMNMGGAISFKQYEVKNDFLGTLSAKSGFASGKYDSIKVAMPSDDSAYKNSVIYYADTKKTTSRFYRFKNLDKKDAYTVYGGSNHPMYTIKTPVKGGRTLLLVKDSYANSMIPYLMQYYTEIVVIDPRYYYDSLQDVVDMEQVDEVLFLYNANTFFEDGSLSSLLNEG